MFHINNLKIISKLNNYSKKSSIILNYLITKNQLCKFNMKIMKCMLHNNLDIIYTSPNQNKTSNHIKYMSLSRKNCITCNYNQNQSCSILLRQLIYFESCMKCIRSHQYRFSSLQGKLNIISMYNNILVGKQHNHLHLKNYYNFGNQKSHNIHYWQLE